MTIHLQDGQAEGGRDPIPETRITRQCLICRKPFESAIDSEFVCTGCKAELPGIAA